MTTPNSSLTSGRTLCQVEPLSDTQGMGTGTPNSESRPVSRTRPARPTHEHVPPKRRPMV